MICSVAHDFGGGRRIYRNKNESAVNPLPSSSRIGREREWGGSDFRGVIKSPEYPLGLRY